MILDGVMGLGKIFYIGNSNTSTTAASGFYMSGLNNNSAFSISVESPNNTTITHNNSGNWIFDSAQSSSIYFIFNNATNLQLTSTSATFYNNLNINGTTTLTGAATLNNNLSVSPKHT